MTPGRLEGGTTGQYRQEGSRWRLVDHQVQQFQGCWVSPVQVFQDKEHWLMFGKFQEDGDESFQRFLPLTLW